MQTKQSNFLKRNIYYFIIAFVLIATITITVILITTNNNDVIGTGGQINNSELKDPNENSGGDYSIPDDSGHDENKDVNEDDKPPVVDPDDKVDDKKDEDPPVVKKISFILPVENATILNDYTATSLIYNKTLNIYTGHMAIDFACEEGSEVRCVYDGVVESISTSYLTGTTLTILHDNGVKSVYNCIEVDENIEQGNAVKQGDVIGRVSNTNKQEYKDGSHLHFEAYENNQKISPYKYLSPEEK